MVVHGEGAVSYERGTPIAVCITITCLLFRAEVDFAGRVGLRGWTMDLLALSG